MLSSSFSAALIAVKASARWLTSVAITWSLCCGGEQRVDAVAGADVERARDVPTRCQRCEPRRCRRVRRDVLRRVVDAAGEAVERHQELFRRDEASERDELLPVHRGEAERQQRVDPVLRERFGRSRELDRQLQEEEARGDRERRAVAAQSALVNRDVRRVGRERVLAEEVVDRVLGVLDAAQGGAQPGCGIAVGHGLEALAAHVGPRD